MTDLERIRVIEETLGITMYCVPLEELFTAHKIEHYKFSYEEGTCNYSLGENRQLIGLSLFDVNFNRLPSGLLESCLKLERLSLSYTDIHDCSFLGALTSLKELNLSFNQLWDISPLSTLVLLDKLDLSCNLLQDISPLNALILLNELNLSFNQLRYICSLNSLTVLKKLNLACNQLQDVPYLNASVSLKELDLSENQLKDVSLLSALVSLEKLNLAGNGIQDVSPLSTLGSLRELCLANVQLQNIFPLRNLVSLKELDLSDNDLQDVSQLNTLVSLEKLDLADNGIRNVAPLSTLVSLCKLYLANNCLQDVSSLSNLIVLKELDLRSNQLQDASSLSSLVSLNKLDLSGNRLQDISPLSTLVSLKELELSGNTLKDFTPLKNLTSLKELYLSHNDLQDISSLSNLFSLDILYLSGNGLQDISSLSTLVTLKELHLSGNSLQDVSPLSPLISLTKSDLSHNGLHNVSPLSTLIKINELDLSNNELQDVSPLRALNTLEDLSLGNNRLQDTSSLNGIVSLNKLYLSGNGIQDVSPLSTLVKLKVLDLSDNGLQDVSSLGTLSALESLSLTNNRLQGTSSLSGITSLNKLYLSENGIQDISPLSTLFKIKELNLSDNDIQNVSPLSNLATLIELDLRNNRLKDVFPLHTMVSLRDLDLSDNEVQDISCFRDWKGSFLSLYNNPIPNVEKEVFEGNYPYNCLEGLQDYWRTIEKYGETENRQFKILLLGNGRVGKSSVADRLLDKGFDTERGSTHAIYLENWTLEYEDKPLDIRIWDFGGQDIYHGTHRLFMRNKTLYLLVWDAVSEYKETNADPKGDKYKNFRLHYWLDYIKRFSPESPIIIVQNKAGEKEDNDKRAPDEIEKLKNEYNIADYICLSSKKGGEEIEELIKKIKKTVPQMTDCLRMIPKPWDAVRKRIEQIAETRNIISYQEYQEICVEEHISEISNTSEKSLIEFLHNTGTAYYNSELSDEIILNQQWAIEAIYTLFDRNEAYHQLLGKGKFTRKDLAAVAWKDHSKETQEVFLSFMLSAELSFRLNGRLNEETAYIAPQLLPEMSGEHCNRRKSKYTGALYLQYRHRFYHEGVMFRFIARLGQLVGDNDNFRNRNFLEIEDGKGNQAYIEKLPQGLTNQNSLSGTIEIGVLGKTPKDFLDRIRNEFEKMVEGAIIETYVSVNSVDYVEIEEVKENFEQEIPVMLNREKKKIKPSDFQAFFSKSTEDSLTEQKEKHSQEGTEIQKHKYKALHNPAQHIYFSYAWANGEYPHIEKTINKVYDSLKEDYSLKRDKMDLGYQGVISKFMDEIGNGKLVVLGLSKKYLYSEYCMNELHKMYLNSQGKIENFATQALPIWVEQLNINDISFKRELFTHWKNKEQEMQEYISDFPDMISPQEHKQLDMIRQAKQNISTLLAFVADINALNPLLLAENDFEKLRSKIEKRLT